MYPHSARADSMIGREVNDFVIEAKLAEGGMGAVFVARHRLLPDTRKVVKLLLPEYAHHPAIRQRFEREARAASRLKHERILGIDGFGMLDDGQLFIMVPFLEGQPFDGHLRARGGRLSPHRALHVAAQLGDALDYAHDNGVIHRDLKPGNVFVIATNANPCAVKLLDFGIAKLTGADAGPETRSGIAIGTPAYMAVEQYEHADEATHLADVQSLAIMIWEMVSGRLPWTHPDRAVLYFQQRTTIPERPPTDVMPAAWTDILLSALAVDPYARPQSIRALIKALASTLPAIGLAPSGAEILADVAPHFIEQAAPGDETVRNVANHDRIGPLLWPPRERISSNALPPLNVLTASGQRVTAPARPAVPRPVSPLSTLAASSGSTSVPSPATVGRWRVAVLALGTCALAATVTVAVARLTTGSRPASSPLPPTAGEHQLAVPDAGSGSIAVPIPGHQPVREPIDSGVPVTQAGSTAAAGSNSTQAPSVVSDESRASMPRMTSLRPPTSASTSRPTVRRAPASTIDPSGSARNTIVPDAKQPDAPQPRPFDPNAAGGIEP